MNLVPRIGSAALVALVFGCHAAAPPVAISPRIDGDQVAFPADAPQLGSLHVQPVESQLHSTAELFGRLVWNEDETARVFTPFAGRVRRILVEPGQTVGEGQPLAEVESADFGQAQADARTAESDLQLAEQNLSRLRELYDHGAAARKEVEAAAADRERASSQRARTLARLAAYRASADSVNGLFVLRSPVRGTVVERNVCPGQEVRPDQMLANAPQLFSPLFVISDPSRLWIDIDATERELPALRPGAALTLTTPAFPGRVFHGRMDRVSEAVDPVTRTLKARGVIENPDHALKAEMFVSVRLPIGDVVGASVPSGAVYLKGDRHYVFVEERPGCFARREVRVRAEQGDRMLVSGAVRPGQRVVTDGCVLLEQLLD